MKRTGCSLLVGALAVSLQAADALVITDAARLGPGASITVHGRPNIEVVFNAWSGSGPVSGTWVAFGGALILDSNGNGTYFQQQGLGNSTAFRAKTTESTPELSLNAFGYTFINLPAGYAGYSNPFAGWVVSSLVQHTSLFPPPVSGTIVSKWNPGTSSYTSSTYNGSTWSNPNLSFSVGEGARIYSPSTQNLVSRGSITNGTTITDIFSPNPAKYLIGPIGFAATPNTSYNFSWANLGYGYPAASFGAYFYTINADGTETQTYVSGSGAVPFVYGSGKFFQGLPGKPYQEWSVTRTVW